MLKIRCLFTFFTILTACLTGNENCKHFQEIFEEKASVTKHTLNALGKTMTYQAVAGNIVIKNSRNDPKASFFYVAYFKDGEGDSQRPITYCFNGGPGSASIWLNLGCFGPKIVDLTSEGYSVPPYSLKDNAHSLLDLTDLVFIDAISSGFSRVAPDEDPKQFHGVDEDIKAFAEFIRLFTTKYQRWESPKYLVGESYGATRAVGLAAELHDTYFFYVNGIILVSSVLDFQTIGNSVGNDLPYILFFPSYTSAAFYHKKLSSDLLKDFFKTLNESKDFALNEYSLALLKGDLLTIEERKAVIEKIHRYTGLAKDYIDRSNLRVNASQFRKQLFSNESKQIGRFDSRVIATDMHPLSEYLYYDPSFENVLGIFTATFNHYARTQLNWNQDMKYETLVHLFPWDYGKKNQYLNLTNSMRNVMIKNPELSVFVANGYYDLATPFFATEYTFNHLNLDAGFKKKVTMGYYDAGHMMYTHEPSLIKLNGDIREFIKRNLTAKRISTTLK